MFFLFALIDVGVFNESKLLIISSFFIFNLLFNIMVYFGDSSLTKRELFKAKWFLAIIFTFTIFSVFTAAGIYFPAEDHKPDWTQFNIEYSIDNNTYNVTVQVEVETSTLHGFFIDSPLSLSIYGGYVRFNEGEVTKNNTVELKISFMPYPYNKRTNREMDTLTILDTTPNKDTNNTYDVVLPKDTWIIGYPYSGSKELISTLMVDGLEVASVSGKELVNIEKGHVKVQFDFTRAIYILTIWIIFLGFCPIFDRILDWYISNHPSQFWNL